MVWHIHQTPKPTWSGVKPDREGWAFDTEKNV